MHCLGYASYGVSCGVVIAEGILSSDKIFENHGLSWGYLILLYVFVQVSRFVVVGTLYPFLRYFGYGLDWKEATILIWSGLRGAVALSLSLSVKASLCILVVETPEPKRSSDGSSYITSDVGTLFVFFTGGIVFLTLIVNGSTTQYVLHFLEMDKLSATKRRILDYTKYEMLNKALEAFGDLGDDEELGPADWPTVKKYITSLNNLEGGCVHPHSTSETDNNLDPTNLKDIRIRLLNDSETPKPLIVYQIRPRTTSNQVRAVSVPSPAPSPIVDIVLALPSAPLRHSTQKLFPISGVQAAYWGMLDEGRITQNIANLLMQSVDEAIDLAADEPLCDWKGVKENVAFPNYYRFLQTSMFPQKLVTYFTVERLESACYICAAFLRAHRIARQQLRDFIGDSSIASIAIEESKVEGEEARKFLEDVRVTFPQVLRVVKTRQVTYSVLNHLINYVQNLEKVGLLEEKEMLHLHDSVQTDLKRLLRNPPLVKFPKISDLISVHPLLGALPSTVRELLESSTKEIMKPRGVTLYREGSRPNGVWLISNGIVKWTSKSIKNKHLLHPTFTHGSTLGLYEVVIGKPYICDIVTDSVVLCLFIEREQILSVLRSDPAIEDFLWQESAIILVRLLLPQIFEKLTMQELRVLVAERSIMTTYLRGESIEIPHNSIGFLLEGFVKTHCLQEELITSPASLFPLQGNLSFRSVETSGFKTASFSHQGSCYQAEARARVIVFDIVSFETNSALLRRPSSLLSNSGDQTHRSLSKEHGYLMTWPEHFYKARQQKQNLEGTDHKANSLSARAMQLSIFGSMIDIPRRPKSFSCSSEAKPADSLSYPRVASHHGYPLTSVRSEGDATVRKKLEARKSVGQIPSSSLQIAGANERHAVEDSSDESGGEDETLVRIDSPSRLSFRQAS
ncbi:hypothetical protein JRO89_XS05G0192200 [Xanthoceras sorbifolium]|uniref:Cyclic nucleotide-binding domain-containing protein n=1 Tax=Xanthoceras sorbifolium TaxID=99658 RepID=A0ABQ8I2G4_9ROSI|nr:hypothetical protein JRO89_XS05G0192200 [Xanthoceras sorbifolium]